ncbi:MAG: prepilin-type cleavage/methylation domain-containing protein [Cyanobacteria bacterium J06632_22]
MAGVIAAIAAPSWLSYARRQQLNRATGDLTQVLQTAQSDAQRLSSPRQVTISSGSPPTVEVASVSTELGSADQNDGIELAGAYQNGGTANVASTTLTFTHKGNVDNAPFVFSLTSETGGEPRCVVVTTLIGNVVQAEGDECSTDQWLTP